MDIVANADKFRAKIGGVAVAGVAFAACAQPLLPHTNRAGLAFGGFLLALTLFTFYQADLRPGTPRDQKNAKRVGVGLAAVTVIWLAFVFAFASSTADAFDRECKLHQQRMSHADTLSPTGESPASGHDTFAAMQCRWVPLPKPHSLASRNKGSGLAGTGEVAAEPKGYAGPLAPRVNGGATRHDGSY